MEVSLQYLWIQTENIQKINVPVMAMYRPYLLLVIIP